MSQLTLTLYPHHREMKENAKLYKIHKDDFPSVMTVFHFGTELILASSQKGGNAITYTRDNGVSRLVDECISSEAKSNEAKCGEMSAAQLWQRLNPGKQISTAKVVTITVISNNRNNALATEAKDLKVWPPCSKDVVSVAPVQYPSTNSYSQTQNRAVAVMNSLGKARSSTEKSSPKFGRNLSRTPQQAGFRPLCRFCLSFHPSSRWMQP